jgi:hypothetical protein
MRFVLWPYVTMSMYPTRLRGEKAKTSIDEFMLAVAVLMIFDVDTFSSMHEGSKATEARVKGVASPIERERERGFGSERLVLSERITLKTHPVRVERNETYF